MLRTHIDVHGATKVHVWLLDSPIASLGYGDGDQSVCVYLTPEQSLKLATDAAQVVAGLRARGLLPEAEAA